MAKVIGKTLYLGEGELHPKQKKPMKKMRYMEGVRLFNGGKWSKQADKNRNQKK